MMLKGSRKKIILIILGWSLVIAFLVVIFIFSNQDGEKSNDFTHGLIEKLKILNDDAQKQSYFKIERKGNLFFGYYSTNKSNWIRIEKPIDINLNNSVYIGIAAAPRKDKEVCTAEFDQIIFKSESLGAQTYLWNDADIGKAKIPGTLNVSNDMFTIGASTSNVFHYMFMKSNGDFSIIARLRSVRSKDVEAKAGIMIRNSLEPGSKLVEVIMTPEGYIHLISKGDSGYYISKKLKAEYFINKIFRKVLHFTEYLILSLLIYMNLTFLNPSLNKKSLLVLIICVILASFDEVHQMYVPGRTPLITDVFIDTSGAMVGLLFMHFIRKVRKRLLKG